MSENDNDRHTLNQIARDVKGIIATLEHHHKMLQELREKIMALSDDLKVGIQQLNDETNAIGTLITKLAAGIKNSMTDAEVADVKAGLGTLSDRLTSLAVDPNVPVPPPPPPLVALKKK